MGKTSFGPWRRPAKKEEVVAKPSDEATEQKSEQELTEEEQKQHIKAQLGEDVLRTLEAEGGEGAQPTIDEPCKKCKGREERLCKECGCMECGGKTPPEKLLFCEECEFVIHFGCLPEPIESLDDLPGGRDADFYCPLCKNSAEEIVQKVNV